MPKVSIRLVGKKKTSVEVNCGMHILLSPHNFAAYLCNLHAASLQHSSKHAVWSESFASKCGGLLTVIYETELNHVQRAECLRVCLEKGTYLTHAPFVNP